ncbi:phosphatidylglycerol/phosphatidylinositol transfer protein-like [Teratosphaeria destructans]|uniref:Phosphatidylglycerol/phosphatidylinositol transfer protein n=1 Tax=Teratosphaeria destructans TaxID=418781 RepID=A0A9W7SMQ0_9PEZI|nr:phosphatidylglycerol/phosphatidylinositol transfer protein-like [Teratosphaeria destructans]
MKFLSTILLASTASASLFGSSIKISPNVDGSLSVPGENPLQHCEDPKDDILDLKSVDLDPNPPKAGNTLKIAATGQLSKDVEEGAKIHLTIKYGLITIIRQEVDLCENAGKLDIECPLEKDEEVKLTKEVDLPSQIPPGKYTVVADVYTKSEEKVTCLTATVEFKRGGNMVVVGQQPLRGLEEPKQGL